jgi:hypothetical protein
MRKCTNIFTIYEEVFMSFIQYFAHPIPINFLIYEENFLFFFNSVFPGAMNLGLHFCGIFNFI